MQAQPFRPCPKIFTRHVDRRRVRVDEEALIKAVYREVDDRDGRPCRCCGRLTKAGLSMERRREHHHMRTRGAAPKAIKHTTANVISVDAYCHLLIGAGKIKITGTNANGPLSFSWTSLSTAREREGLRLQNERPRPEWAAR